MSSPHVQTVRQRFNVAMGFVGVAIGALIMIGTWGGVRQLPGLFFGLAFALLAYLVLARPHLRISSDELIVSNVVREVALPWEGISHASSRGSLVVHDTDGGKTTAWGISNQKAKRASDAGDPSVRGRSLRPGPGELVAHETSAQALREGINAETVDNPDGVPSHKRVRFLPVPTVGMALAVVCLIAGVAVQ